MTTDVIRSFFGVGMSGICNYAFSGILSVTFSIKVYKRFAILVAFYVFNVKKSYQRFYIYGYSIGVARGCSGRTYTPPRRQGGGSGLSGGFRPSFEGDD